MEVITDAMIDTTLWERLNQVFEDFPVSSPESTMLYNHVKLLEILQQKEVLAFTDDAQMVKRALKLTTDAGRTVEVINTDPEKGILQYNEAVQAMEQELSGYLYVFAKQWALSVKALYHYKKKEYRQAFAQTQECLALSDYLVREGISTLIVRSAEQVRNLSRVLLKMGDWEQSTVLAGKLFRYLVNGDGEGMYSSLFKEEKHWNALPYIREGYTYEYFRGLVMIMVKENPYEQDIKRKLYQRFFGDVTFEVNTPDRQIMYNWLYIKKLFYDEEYAAFIDAFIDFMQEDLSQVYDVLKVSFFQDITYLLQRTAYIGKSELLARVKHHLDNKLNTFNRLRSDVSRSEYGQNDFPIAFPGS